MVKTLKINHYLPSTISTREAVRVIDKYLVANMNIVFDFEGVRFISRAFADELMKSIIKKKIKARFVNTNAEIIQLLDVVNRTLKDKRSDIHDIPVIQFSDKQQLHQFLESIDEHNH